MTDGQFLLLLFLAFYLSECGYWLPRRAVVFRGPGKVGVRARGVSGVLNNAKGGFVWTAVLPPAGRDYACEPWPFSVTAEGLSSSVPTSPNPGWPPPDSGVSLGWDAVERITYDKKILCLNGQYFASCMGTAAAREHTRLLEEIRAAGGEQRPEIIRGALATALSEKSVIESRQRCEKVARNVKFAGMVVFLFLFGVLPVAYRVLGDSWVVVALAGGLWLAMITASVMYFRAHRRLFPTLRGERWQHLLASLFAPQHAARCADGLVRGALGTAYPAAAAGGDTAFLGAFYRDLRHPVPDGVDSVAREFRERFLLPAVEGELEERGLQLDKLTGPPKREDEADTHFCPRCHQLYTSEASGCPECGGLGLVPFGDRSGSGL